MHDSGRKSQHSKEMHQYRSYIHHNTAAFSLPVEFFHSRRILQWYAGMVYPLLYLHQYYIGGKTKSRLFPALHGRDTALLLHRFFLSGVNRPEQQNKLFFWFCHFCDTGEYSDQCAAFVPYPAL
ncbi:hypothetical protein [Faecalibaculum rodentium]|uniref:hypothetical protein n=1 Tax=Faecalibaculum rodentium TaxID=1702221 RepID=UPI0027154653|nr:hypothetical protein [Faecalibaculum rodentium]